MSHPLLISHRTDVDKILAHYKAQADGVIFLAGQMNFASGPAVFGVPLSNNWSEIITKFVASLWAVLGNAGSQGDVSAAISTAVLQFYDTVLGPALATASGRPWIFNTLVGPAIRNMLPGLITGVISALFAINKGPVQPATPTTPTAPGQPQVPTGFIPY